MNNSGRLTISIDRCETITHRIGKPKGIVLVDENGLASTAVNIHDLSAFMLEHLVSDEWVRKAPLVSV